MSSWTLSLHWSCLCWQYYHHPYVWSAPSRQSPPINTFAAILRFKLSWPKTKLQNVGAGDPPSTILIHGVPVEGVEEFIYLGSKQSSNGYCRPDVPMQDWTCLLIDEFSTKGMEMQFSQYQHQIYTPVPSSVNVCPALWCRNMNPWQHSIVVRTMVSTSELSISCARLLAGWVTTLWLSRQLLVSQHGLLSHPSSGVGKWVVIHVIRYMDYGVET